jgi:hypothetical protein
MEEARTVAQTASPSVGTTHVEGGQLFQWAPKSPAHGQLNLFTGEIDLLADEPSLAPEELWLFDPDFGLVLPEGVAARRFWSKRKLLCRSLQVTGYRSPEYESRIAALQAGPLVFGKRPFVPEKPQVAKTADCVADLVEVSPMKRGLKDSQEGSKPKAEGRGD